MSKGRVYFKNQQVGSIEKNTDGSFNFGYLPEAKPVSWTLPTIQNTYISDELFPFFDGLWAPKGEEKGLTTTQFSPQHHKEYFDFDFLPSRERLVFFDPCSVDRRPTSAGQFHQPLSNTRLQLLTIGHWS